METTYDPAAVQRRFVNTIDGRGVDGAERLTVLDPATGEPCCTVPCAGPAELDAAVAAAGRAQPAWAAYGTAGRKSALRDLAQALRIHGRELASLIVTEQGKPMPRALEEVGRAARQLELLLDIDLHDEILTDSTGRPVRLQYRPLGVVGAITPWNMPLVLLIPKIAHALYTGNTIVVKPSPFTPLCALRVGELAAGIFPAGVVNVLAGDAPLGQAMSEHAAIQKIAFTGSVGTGKRIMASAAATLKRLTLELGGNDAAIVLPDADPDAIAPKLFAGAFANAGQVCMAIKRLYVPDELHDAVVQALGRLARDTVLGPGCVPGTHMGPLQNAAQREHVLALLEDARARGARVLGGGPLPDAGYFVRPVIVTGLDDDAPLVAEEQFGPVLPVLSYAGVEEAIARANASPFGLGASVWSADPERARAVAARLDAGSVWINHHIGADVLVPFGGWKESGIGAQYSLAGLRSFMQAQALYAPSPL